MGVVRPQRHNGDQRLLLHHIGTYIFRRECSTSDAEGKPVGRTVVEVVSLNMPGEVLGKTKNGSYVKTVHSNAKGTVTTLAFVSPDVPGGVVGHDSKEVDNNGRLVRRTTLKVTAYSTDPDKDRTGPFGRKRARRDRTKSAGR